MREDFLDFKSQYSGVHALQAKTCYENLPKFRLKCNSFWLFFLGFPLLLHIFPIIVTQTNF